MLRILLCYFLLASAHDIPSTARPKRDLWSFKNLVASKLFGTDTVVVQLPKIPKNETYQLFKIKGYDNIFLKVTRKPEKETVKPVKIKFEESVMVSPEMAIIGNYLGTPTQRETLLALEIAKNLLKTGILSDRDKVVHEVVAPMPPHTSYKSYIVREPVKSVEVITEERDPALLDQPVIEAETFNVVNRRPVAVYPAEYPPMIVAHEVQYRPFQTKYSYKQETEGADITYESYNNRGVIVTRTDKVPAKPRYIAIRFADVISIAANPSSIGSQEQDTSTVMTEEYPKEQLNVLPIHSYVTEKKPSVVSEDTTSNPEKVAVSGCVDSNDLNEHPSSLDKNPPKVTESLRIPNFIKQLKHPFDIRDHLTDGEIDKLNKFINEKLDLSKNNENEYTPRPYNDENYSDGDINNEQKLDPGDSKINTSQINTGNIVSRFSFGVGDEGQRNFTMRIEDPKQNRSEVNLINSSGVIPQNYIYIPPNVDVPPPMPNTNNITSNVPFPISNTDNINDQSNQNKYDEYEAFNSDAENVPKTSVPLRGDLGLSKVATDKPEKLKTNYQYSSTKNPIVVPKFSQKLNNVSTSKGGITTSTRRPYTGGRGANTTSRDSNPRPFTRGSGVIKS